MYASPSGIYTLYNDALPPRFPLELTFVSSFITSFHYEAGGANLSSLPFSYGLLSRGLDTSVSNNPLIRQWWTIHLVCKAANLPIHWAEPSAVIRRPTLMISASGSNPLERCTKYTLILQVIQLMNDPGPEALADPTLIMLRELHLGGTVGRLAKSETTTQEKVCCPNAARSLHFQSECDYNTWEKWAVTAAPWRTLQQHSHVKGK